MADNKLQITSECRSLHHCLSDIRQRCDVWGCRLSDGDWQEHSEPHRLGSHARNLWQLLRGLVIFDYHRGNSCFHEGLQENTTGLLYCVGVTDCMNIRWPLCSESQHLEYLRYKSFTIMVLIAYCTTNRRFTFVDIRNPCVRGDSTIFKSSSLKLRIDNNEWLGPEIPDLMVANIPIRGYLISDSAFSISVNMMKTSLEQEKAARPMLYLWYPVSLETRRPIERVFEILKKGLILRDGPALLHEDDMLQLIFSCVCILNLSIYKEDI